MFLVLGQEFDGGEGFHHVDIELTKSCTGPTLMSLRSVEVFVRPIESHVIFCKWIEEKITHILSVGSRDHCTVLI